MATNKATKRNKLNVKKGDTVRINPQGGISTMEAPLHASNVMLVCPSCKAATRVGHRINDAGKKVRVCKKCGKDID